MEQQQFKVSWSVGTKLILGGVLLLVVVITFLSVSAIFLLKEDKKAYLYQTQATEAVLVGREFANTGRRVLGTLRLALASVDPAKPLDATGTAGLRSVAENQSDSPVLLIYLVRQRPADVDLALFSRMPGQSQGDFEGKWNPATFELSASVLARALPELLERSYCFIDLTSASGFPLLGIAFADLKMKDNPGGVPVALAVLPMGDFIRQLAASDVTIATRSGRLLLSSKAFSDDLKRDPLFQAAVASQVATGAKEYDLDGERYLGSFLNAGMDLVVVNRTEWKKAMRATYALTEKFAMLGLIAVAIAVVLTMFFAKTLTAPINRLYEATKEVAAGKFELDLETHSRDEIGALTDSFKAMSRQISGLIQERMKSLQMENDLMIAATVQQTLLPPPMFQNKNVAIHSHYKAADQCGGDWWGFFQNGERLTFMIADATGHGFPSALITASARSCVSMIQKFAEAEPDRVFSPSVLLSYANRVIHDASQGKIMMTFLAGVIDFSNNTLTFASAGHNPAWLFSKNGDGYTTKSLVANGPRLGERQDVEEFEEKTIPVSPGDLLFLYTDGLLEGTGTDGSFYGKKRAVRMIQSNVQAGPEQVIRNLVADFMAHNGGKSFDDDLTVAAALLLSPHAGEANA
ncbi:MAG: hypothetical protein A2X94_10690 [Bdellovibrionales bacterium GWB1_55_8]|nr:MAG: hypothetical protein A2X94_10690 [Bdellovibrionales bacterium GWB1_55_8]